MRVISTRTHACLDYIVGVLLIAAPFLLGFYQGGIESWVPITLGGMTIIYSLLTDYEFGLVPWLSVRAHLGLDLFAGVLLAFSPWIFDFKEYIWQPHLVVGLAEIVITVMTKKYPEAERRSHSIGRPKVHESGISR